MSTTCGNIEVSVTCDTEENTAVVTPEKIETGESTVILNLPEGAQIVAPDGTVLYEQPTGPDKSKIKM